MTNIELQKVHDAAQVVNAPEPFLDPLRIDALKPWQAKCPKTEDFFCFLQN